MAIASIERDVRKLTAQLAEILPDPSWPQIPPDASERIEGFSRELQSLLRRVRASEPTPKEIEELSQEIRTLKEALEEGWITLQACCSGDPRLRELSQSIRHLLRRCRDVLVDLRILAYAYRGYRPTRLRPTLGRKWESLLDHILLYHDMKDREQETEGSLPLEELVRRYGL